MMDKVIITVPDWMIYAFGVWLLLSVIGNALEIYKYWLNFKLKGKP